jgi:histidinol dehydrogenase
VPDAVRETTRKVFGADLSASEVVSRILADVEANGDEAVARYNREIDGVKAVALMRVSPEEVSDAYSRVDGELVEALKFAAARIERYHRNQLKHAARSFEQDGLGQLVRPIQRVGLYVPGNVVIYPSTLLMTAVPARVAGVAELIVVTPANPDGSVADLKLVAADIAGVDEVYLAGGVQGIGALAFGTETVPRVDKICGPGNIFVTLAKRALFGRVGIDGIFGPSETLVVADGGAEPRAVGADVVAGAEHDELATAVLLTDSAELAEAVASIVEEQVDTIGRAASARMALDARGGAAVVESVDEAISLANEYAPEHLCLHLDDGERYLGRIRNAGCVFAGHYSVESIGDYTAGPSHVMPTGGSARFSSALGVHDFLKVTSLVRLDPETAREVGPAGVAIGYAEGLAGHARAIEARLERE